MALRPSAWKPTREQLLAAKQRRVKDLIRPGLNVLFVGINPGLYSGAIGHHFGRPGNRFWPVLFRAGFTPREFSPFEESELLKWSYGITNLVPRATATADQLAASEIARGAATLIRKIRRHRPHYAAFLGLGTYRLAFHQRCATVGPQPDPIGSTRVWLLPNPSGLNAHYQLPQLVAEFVRLRLAVERDRTATASN